MFQTTNQKWTISNPFDESASQHREVSASLYDLYDVSSYSVDSRESYRSCKTLRISKIPQGHGPRSCIFQTPVVAFAVEFLHTEWAKSSRLPLKSSRNPAPGSTIFALFDSLYYWVWVNCPHHQQPVYNIIQNVPTSSKLSLVCRTCWQPALHVLCSPSSPPKRPSRQLHAGHHRWARPHVARPAAMGRQRSPAVLVSGSWNMLKLYGFGWEKWHE